MPRMRRLAALVAVPAAALALASPAAAQEDGVFFDDESPAGKEYAIPSDQARSQSGGGGPSGGGPGAGSANGGGAPLFGQGVTRAQGRAGSRDGAGGSGPGGRSSGNRSADGEPGIRFTPPSPGRIEADDASSSPVLWMGGAAVAIFFAGGLVATAARGRRRRVFT